MDKVKCRMIPVSEVILSDYDRFDCGNEVLNNYLYASGYSDPDAVTYVVINENKHDIVAYFSLSCGAVYHKIYENRIEHYPAVEIKNFAVDTKYQHMEDDDGDTLALTILEYIKYNLIMDFTESVCGASRIILYSVPDAVNFYKKAGFKAFVEDFIKNNMMYLEGCIPLIFNY